MLCVRTGERECSSLKQQALFAVINYKTKVFTLIYPVSMFEILRKSSRPHYKMAAMGERTNHKMSAVRNNHKMLRGDASQTLLKHLLLQEGAEKSGLGFYFRKEARGHLETFYLSHWGSLQGGHEFLPFVPGWVIITLVHKGGSASAVSFRLQISYDLMLLHAKVCYTEKTCMPISRILA